MIFRALASSPFVQHGRLGMFACRGASARVQIPRFEEMRIEFFGARKCRFRGGKIRHQHARRSHGDESLWGQGVELHRPLSGFRGTVSMFFGRLGVLIERCMAHGDARPCRRIVRVDFDRTAKHFQREALAALTETAEEL